MNNKLFTKYTLYLIIICLLINIGFVYAVSSFNLPIYLDSIGTILAAALGGVIPGMLVGFFSNCLNTVFAVSSDPLTLYYGFISVLIAIAATWLSYRYGYKRIKNIFRYTLYYAFFGGVVGSILTWILYGFSVGGLTEKLAKNIQSIIKISDFFAQITSGLIIDIIDKFITVVIIYAIIRFLPKKLLNKFNNGPLANRKINNKMQSSTVKRQNSMRTKITVLILSSTALLSIILVLICMQFYKNKMVEIYTNECETITSMMKNSIDGDNVDKFLKNGNKQEGYIQTKNRLTEIKIYQKTVKYMYVYKISKDGCHVVFDLDTDDTKGAPVGTVIAFNKSFKPYIQDLTEGKNLKPIISHGKSGNLLTVYKPVFNSFGTCVCYVGADIEMNRIWNNVALASADIASLVFGALMLIAAFALWYCDNKIIIPINMMVNFTENSINNRLPDFKIKTGDELEKLFITLKDSKIKIEDYICELNKKNNEILQMQRNIIYSLAEMVESRDENTGAHIQRTAEYVKLIGMQLLKDSKYSGILTKEYVNNMYESAPLHDIGKIKISDSILNKAGRLTEEEFEVMKKHTTYGREILQKSLEGLQDPGYLDTAMQMAYYHHERYDGSGYPNGLAKDQIPLCARIMAVADVFDALVSKRSYKEAFSYERAYNIINSESGTHFDPVIVKEFFKLEDKIKPIIKM